MIYFQKLYVQGALSLYIKEGSSTYKNEQDVQYSTISQRKEKLFLKYTDLYEDIS